MAPEMHKTPLLKLITDGKEYTVFTDGTVKGFEHEVLVVNYFPALVRTAVVRARIKEQRNQDGFAEGA